MTYDYFELLKCSSFIQMKKEKAKLVSDTITSGLFVSNARFPFTFSHRRQLRIPLQAQKTSSLPSWEIIIFYFRVFLFFCCNVCVIFKHTTWKIRCRRIIAPFWTGVRFCLRLFHVEADYPALKALLHIHQHSVFCRCTVCELLSLYTG